MLALAAIDRRRPRRGPRPARAACRRRRPCRSAGRRACRARADRRRGRWRRRCFSLRHQRVVDALVDDQAAQRWCSAGLPCPWRRRRCRAARGRDRRRARRWRRCCRRVPGWSGRSGRRARGRPAGPWRSSRWPRPAATRWSSTSASPTSRPPIRISDRPFGHVAEFRGGALDDGLHGERRERRLFRGLPDGWVAADEGERGVPGPDRDGEVEGGDDAARRRAGARSPSSGGRGAPWRW